MLYQPPTHMQQLLHIKYLRIFFFAVIFWFGCGGLQAQSTDSLNVKHVRLDVARMGLHCPFLGPKLVQKLKDLPDAQNVTLFMMPSYITFDLPAASAIPEQQIADLAVLVGYPKQDVTVKFDH
jgi:hypothetical protein